VRRTIIATLLAALVVMASDACDHVTDKEVVRHLVEAMRRAHVIELDTGAYPGTFEVLEMDDLRSFTSTHLVAERGGLCIELLVQESGAYHLTSAAPKVVEDGRCDG
jgi:hypothetical protein